MNLTEIKKMISGVDYSIIESVYIKIGLKSMIDFLTEATRHDSYYQSVYNKLLDLAHRELDVPEDKLERGLTVGGMLRLSELGLINKSNNIDYNDSIFIIEKLLVEPLELLRY